MELIVWIIQNHFCEKRYNKLTMLTCYIWCDVRMREPSTVHFRWRCKRSVQKCADSEGRAHLPVTSLWSWPFMLQDIQSLPFADQIKLILSLAFKILYSLVIASITNVNLLSHPPDHDPLAWSHQALLYLFVFILMLAILQSPFSSHPSLHPASVVQPLCASQNNG